MNHLPNSWSIDKGSRIQGFEDSSEKALRTNKNNTLIIGVTFYKNIFLKRSRNKGRKNVNVNVISPSYML
jgi:hypothetical protein